MKIKGILKTNDDGSFTISVPALPGCISKGETRGDARINIIKAIEFYFKSRENDFSPNKNMSVENIEIEL